MEPSEQPPIARPRRRAQNATSQRNYRARQKARLENLERFAVRALAGPHPTTATRDQAGQSPQQLAELHITGLYHSNLPDPEVSSYDIRSVVTSCSERERQIFRWICIRERFSMRDLVKYGLILSGHAMNSDTFEVAQDLSARSWLEKVKSALGDVDLKAAATSGIRLLAQMDVPWDQLNSGDGEEEISMNNSMWSTQCNLHVNRIFLSKDSSASAMFANAAQLRIPVDDILGAEAEYTSALHEGTKPDLIPTAAQLKVPHHPCFDAIPWAIFRSNICLAISQHPPLIDDEELCLDMMNEGIWCWGSSAQSLNGRGNGTPWDARSWEAAPWFLEKWESLTGGRKSDIWMNSAWWRSMR